MAGSVNKVILVGNVGADPEVRATQNGGEMATFSLATTESWKDQSGQRQNRTEWHRIVIYSPGLVRVVRDYIKKGSKLYIEGMLRTRSWEDKDSQKRYTTEVVLSGFQGTLTMLDNRRDGDGGADFYRGEAAESSPSNQGEPPAIGEGLDDEIPF